VVVGEWEVRLGGGAVAEQGEEDVVCEGEGGV